MNNLQTIKGNNYPLGVTVIKDGVQFAMDTDSKNCGVELIEKSSKTSYKIPFKEEKTGKISSIIIKNLDISKYYYRFYDGDNSFVDPYANKVYGNENFGPKDDKYSLMGGFVSHESFEWGNDIKPGVSYRDTIIYLLHVRGFTAHNSSKVKNKGCVEGIVQKIPYLKELGITSVELMPSYEFEEYSKNKEKSDISKDAFADFSKVNYWGFKEGFYYAPKASYCASDCVLSFKNFVKEMHKAGLEVIMQFYFPDNVDAWKIIDVCRFWLINYHIDGIHLKGNRIPVHVIVSDPIFADTKLFYDYFPENDLFKPDYIPDERYLYTYSDNYMYQMRKVLKGDEDTLKDLMYFTRNIPEKTALVNFFTNYYGFTLNDLVSFDRKHNEANGENNYDGCDYNFSWNCGVEGKSRKPSVMLLRKRMIKNALLLLMSSKGTPLITAGDELMNSQNGNNNPYCQDNETTYINWNINSTNKEIYDFTKEIIKLRKTLLNPYLQKEYSMLDRDRTGYPDLSYHQDEAWKTELFNYNRHLGIMYSDYNKESKEVTLIYIAYNFYWKNITFSLPFIPNEYSWENILSTGTCSKITADNKDLGEKFEIEQRSIAVFKVTFVNNKKK